MDTSTLIALVAMGLAAVVTVFCLVKFFSGSSSSSRSNSRAGGSGRGSRQPRPSSRVNYGRKLEGFVKRGDGDSYVNLFALFNSAALEEAEAKKAEEEQQKAQKAAARKNRARWRASAASAISGVISGGWRSLKTRVARAIMPRPQPPRVAQSSSSPSSSEVVVSLKQG